MMLGLATMSSRVLMRPASSLTIRLAFIIPVKPVMMTITAIHQIEAIQRPYGVSGGEEVAVVRENHNILLYLH